MATANDVVEKAPAAGEQAALRAWQEGDTQAFGQIVQIYMRRAYYTALGLVGSHADAMDLSQEAFVRAFRAGKRFDPSRRFFTWYYRILRNLCLNHLRQRSRFVELDATPREEGGSEVGWALRAEHADPGVLAERNELTERVWRAVGRMKAEDRELLVLREMQDCSYAEISERLEIPVGTVMSRLFHARRRLKEMLEQSL